MRTYEAKEFVAADAFADGRYAGARRTGTAIFYLLEPDTFSEIHRLKSDEVFHFYDAGDAVEMLQLFSDGSGRRVVIGNDLARGSNRRWWWRVACGRGLGWWRVGDGHCWDARLVRGLSLRTMTRGRGRSCVQGGRSLRGRLRL